MRKIAILAASLSTAAFGTLVAVHTYMAAPDGGTVFVKETGV